MSDQTTDVVTPRFRLGSVVDYTPDRSRHDPRWCREGVAIADERGLLLDTYWQSGSDAHVLSDAEAATAVHRFDLDDYDELDRYGSGSPRLWETYAETDRQRVTSQHGLQSRWFVRKGSSPDLATQVGNAWRALDAAHEEAASASRRVANAAMDLGRLLDQERRDNAPVSPGSEATR